MQLTKCRFVLAARGVQLDNGVTPPPMIPRMVSQHLNSYKARVEWRVHIRTLIHICCNERKKKGSIQCECDPVLLILTMVIHDASRNFFLSKVGLYMPIAT